MTLLERARSRKPVTWLTLAGVLLLPAAIGGLLVAALQNPTEQLDRMTAAIVNQDEPVTIDDQVTPLGRQLAAGLVEGTDETDSNLTWVISNEDDAAAGLRDGTYQAVVTIPEEFSAAATSSGQAIADGGGTAEQATLTVTTAPDARVADGLITQQVADAASATVGSMLSEATLSNVLIGFGTIGDSISDAADGAGRLATGASDAATGASELPTGAQQLASGADELGAGATQLSAGLDTIASSARDAGAGAAQLGSGLSSGADQLERNGIVPAELTGAANGASQATTGVKDGVDGISTGVDELVALCEGRVADPVCIGLQRMQENMPALVGGAGQAAQASAGTATGLSQLATQAPKQIAGQMRTAGAAAQQLGSGLGQLAAGVDQSATGARGLSNGAAQLGTGATALADGAQQLADGVGQLSSGAGELAGGLRTAADSLPRFDEEESKSLASVVADPVSADAGPTTLFGDTAIPLLAAVVLWFGSLATFVALRTVPGDALTSRRPSIALALRGLWPAAAIGAAQGLLVALIVQTVAGYDAAAWWSFAATAVLAGVSFASVNQALIAVLGGAGRWISALIGVVAVATGLISTVPAWLASIGAALPTAPALNGLIDAGGAAIAGLGVWGVLALVATTLATAMRRTTSVKAVLAGA